MSTLLRPSPLQPIPPYRRPADEEGQPEAAPDQHWDATARGVAALPLTAREYEGDA
jgi:hypothetical protein